MPTADSSARNLHHCLFPIGKGVEARETEELAQLQSHRAWHHICSFAKEFIRGSDVQGEPHPQVTLKIASKPTHPLERPSLPPAL